MATATVMKSDLQARIEKINKIVEGFKQQHGTGLFVPISARELEVSLTTQLLTILWQGGPGAPLPEGSSFTYTIGLHNPGLATVGYVFAHTWAGFGHPDPNIGTFLLNVDRRFPTLTEPQTVQGLTLAPNETKALNFLVKLPTGVESTLYTLNTCVMRAHWTGVGDFIARAAFPFMVA